MSSTPQRRGGAHVPQAVKETYESIRDLLVSIGPRLKTANQGAKELLVLDLHRIAHLAEAFVAGRPRSIQKWSDVADELDCEGVNLWNTSGPATSADEDDELVSAMRYAAFRLIEAGLEPSPGIETLIHILQVSSNTAALLSEQGNHTTASSILTSAAQYEEQLRNAANPDDSHRQARACATVVYLSSRMEAAHRESNDSVAQFMLSKIMDDEQRLSLLPVVDRELLASKIAAVGQSILRNCQRSPNPDGIKAQEAVHWIQKALFIIEQMNMEDAVTVKELKRRTLRSLARAYFLSASEDQENIARSEATLQELIYSIDKEADHTKPEFQELRWMRIAVLKRQETRDVTLLEAFKSLIDNMKFDEATITDLILEVKTLSSSVLLADIHLHCLERALRSRADHACIDRILLSFMMTTCSRDKDHSRAMSNLQLAFGHITDADYELPKVSKAAIMTLLWQYGSRHYNAKQWSLAADWFLAGTHDIFRSLGATTLDKCRRKTALCHLESQQYALAAVVIRKCDGKEATTSYISLLIAVNQGLEDESTRILQDMRQSSGFERRMLLLVTRMAHEKSMRSLLLALLEALRESLSISEGVDNLIEAMTLLRCSIRLVLDLLTEENSNRSLLIPSLVSYFVAARDMVVKTFTANTASTAMITKDISWIWRTAYNTGIQGCSEWENEENSVSTIFNICCELIEAGNAGGPTDVPADTCSQMMNASFSSVAARIFSFRKSKLQHQNTAAHSKAILHEIDVSEKRINDILARDITWEDTTVPTRAQSFLCTLNVFKAEILIHLKEWSKISTTVQNLSKMESLYLETFEAVADMLWAETDCPLNVLSTVLETILHAALDRSMFALDKFSRWLRAICTILLARNSNSDMDRSTALGYVEQAITVLADTSSSANDSSSQEDMYPMDEREWLLSTSYNTGLECLHASLYDESKRWFEAATVICRYVPRGEIRSQKISETYSQLLSRYSHS